ncbi:MAG: two-component regulator propeller domain-containing protein, partial [Bacteroidota bacterium]|nr:two-component regulator propeller domain-containing protein [Bacteroidota bacterium]
MKLREYFSVAFFLICCSVYGKVNIYHDFDNFYLGSDASVVYCFIQDNMGLIWMGTDRGLYSYNGYNAEAHLYVPKNSDIKTGIRINCGILLQKNLLFLGTDNGILLYNTITDQYENPEISFGADIRSLVLHRNQLWIGAQNGLYCYNIIGGKIQKLIRKYDHGIPHRTIYSLLNSTNNTLYVGTYNGFCYLDEKLNCFQKIELPILSKKNNLLVNALYEDTRRRCIWVGTEGYLFCYFPATHKVECVKALNGNSIKSLAADNSHNLLVGTDNGLYIYYPEQKSVMHVVHDSRDVKSLTNNIIEAIYMDKYRNAWFGTDYGVSHYRYNKNYSWILISQITGSGDGNQLKCIFKDSRKNLWYGGTNGLIFSPSANEKYIWYKMGDDRYPISHNQIRDIYEDHGHQLWVATDGSINRYNFTKHQFVRYNIVDKTKTRNTNWSYQLFEDKQGRLWIATCLGGIFVVDKQKLLANTSPYYIAEENFYQHKGRGGLSDNYILKIISDKRNNIWALTYNNWLDKINPQTGEVKEIKYTESHIANGSSYSLICDREGYVWVGYFGGLSRINPVNNKVEPIKTDIFKDIRVRSLSEENNHIWISGPDGTFVLNKRNLQLQHVRIISKDFSCSFYDASSQRLYLGGVDGFAVFPSDIIRKINPVPSLVLTGILVNDKFLQAGKDYKGAGIRNLKEITLSHDQNNVSFEFSNLNYSQDEDTKFIYYLEGADQVWRTLRNNTNRISYTNLSPGNYILHIGLPTLDNRPVNLLSFSLTVSPPWYYSLWAKIIYALLFTGFVLWVIRYFQDKHLAKIERIKRKKTLELTRMKIDFFTNVSHDFKTPLSLILGPVSQLLSETKNPQLKKQLNLVRKNALHLNSLIQQVIGFERLDGSPANTLILSQVEFVEFCRGIFSIYQDAFRTKNIQANFIPKVKILNLNIDVVKFESIINNLLSNACKYCNEGGKIEFGLKVDDKNILLSVSDTGIGIPEKDIPFVFDRFFQSEKTKNKLEGTGIGLYLVKSYVELHQGKISIESKEDKGTRVNISFPIQEPVSVSEYISGNNP